MLKNRPQRKTSRRDFMATTVTGAGLLLAGRALAQDATKGASDDINVALIGVGTQGVTLMESMLRIPGVRIKAICDIWDYSRQRGDGILRQYGQKPAVYEDYRELLANEKDLQAAIIATPDFLHAEQAIVCMNAGLHVYCEKPMANRLDLARQMVVEARSTGKLLQIGNQRRSNPRYIHAMQKILHEVHLLGRTTHAYAQWNRPMAGGRGWPAKFEVPTDILAKYGYDSMIPFRNWQWYRKCGGGPLANLGSHQIDVLNWAFGGPPKSVLATGGMDFHKRYEWPDNVICILDYETPEGVSRASYRVLTTTSNGGAYENIMGVNGTLCIAENPALGDHIIQEDAAPDWQPYCQQGLIGSRNVTAQTGAKGVIVNVWGGSLYRDIISWPLPIRLDKPPHQPHLENFFDAARSGLPLNYPAETAYQTAVVIDKINSAIGQGNRMEFAAQEFAV